MNYPDFVNYQPQLPAEDSMADWSDYLSGAQPSSFPLCCDPLGRQGLHTTRI